MSTYQTFSTDEKPLSILDIRDAKNRRKLAMVTAYDTPSARIVDRAGVDMVLVGDSLGMVMLGRNDTLSVTLDEMIHHCRAVVQGMHRALVVADMPFMTYEPGPDAALSNAARLVRESGVRAVKLEGAFLPQIRALVGAGIPVMGHIGLTPQRAARAPKPHNRCLMRRRRSKKPDVSPSCLRPFPRLSRRRLRPGFPFPPSA